MIQTKEDLRTYQADLQRFNNYIPNLKDWLLHNEVWYIFRYIRNLRYVEYYRNCRGIRTVCYLWYFFHYKRLGFKLHFIIYPGTIGSGFRIYHSGGFVHVGPNVTIGKNCTILPGCVFGNKYEEPCNESVTVGDNCYFGLDAKILGGVKIGDNVTVGANSIVTKDIPDNAIVAGIPAKIIRFKKGPNL